MATHCQFAGRKPFVLPARDNTVRITQSQRLTETTSHTHTTTLYSNHITASHKKAQKHIKNHTHTHTHTHYAHEYRHTHTHRDAHTHTHTHTHTQAHTHTHSNTNTHTHQHTTPHYI